MCDFTILKAAERSAAFLYKENHLHAVLVVPKPCPAAAKGGGVVLIVTILLPPLCGNSPAGRSLFVCYADSPPTDGGIFPLHKGACGYYRHGWWL